MERPASKRKIPNMVRAALKPSQSAKRGPLREPIRIDAFNMILYQAR
jgi:hypothetical protein